MHELPDGVTQADLDVVRIHRTLDGPPPLVCPIGKLAKAHHYDGPKPDSPGLTRQKASTKRLKARRQAEWLGLFAVRKPA